MMILFHQLVMLGWDSLFFSSFVVVMKSIGESVDAFVL